jgi:hypothetical protein
MASSVAMQECFVDCGLSCTPCTSMDPQIHPYVTRFLRLPVHMTVFKEKRCIYENRCMSVPQCHGMEPVGGVEVIE